MIEVPINSSTRIKILPLSESIISKLKQGYEIFKVQAVMNQIQYNHGLIPISQNCIEPIPKIDRNIARLFLIISDIV